MDWNELESIYGLPPARKEGSETDEQRQARYARMESIQREREILRETSIETQIAEFSRFLEGAESFDITGE